MTEDDIRQKWFPETRWHRTEYDRFNQYPNCRHHGKTQKADPLQQFHCSEKGKDLTNCNACRTCANCNGRLGLYRSTTDYVRNGAYVTDEYTCLNCGAYYVRIFFVTRSEFTSKPAEMCQVEGCTHRTYEGYKHHDEGKVWTICQAHHRRLKTWAHAGKTLEQKPLLNHEGALVENPKYRTVTVRTPKEVDPEEQRRNKAAYDKEYRKREKH